MKCNVGKTEKLIRLGIAALSIPMFVFSLVSSPANIILGVIGGIALLTGLIGFCPLWTVLGVNTCKAEK